MDMSPDDKAIVDDQNAQIEREMDELAYAYYEVFKTGAGQKVIKDLRERCNVHNSCVRGDAKHPDPYAVMFQEGKRAVYNHIMMNVRHDNERRNNQR